MTQALAQGPVTLDLSDVDPRVGRLVGGGEHWVPSVHPACVGRIPGSQIEGFTCDYEEARIDPRRRDGLYSGPSRRHIDGARSGEVGMARAYGYGATMGAWVHDYLGYWAGHDQDGTPLVEGKAEVQFAL